MKMAAEIIYLYVKAIISMVMWPSVMNVAYKWLINISLRNKWLASVSSENQYRESG